MSKVLVIFGYGPGMSEGILQRFGRSGEYKIALVARNAGRLQAATDAWAPKGVTVKVFFPSLI